MARTLFRISETKLIAAEVSEFNGEPWLAIRTWVKKRDGKWTRTKNGLSIPDGYALELHMALGAYLRDSGESGRRGR